MPTMDCMPFYYAKVSGIYDNIDLDVNIYTYKAQMDCDTAFVNKYVDVSYTDLIRAALLQSKNHPLRVIMQTDGHHELITAKSKRINDIEQLKGKMVAIARHSITDMLLDTVASQSKLDISTIYHPQINNIILRQDMLRNATIDGAFLQEPYITQTKLEGNKAIYDSRDMNIHIMALMVNSNIDKNKEIQISQLIEGYNQAVDAINNLENPDLIKQTINLYPIQKKYLDSINIPVFKHAEPVNKDNINIAIEFLRRRQLIHDHYTGDSLTTLKYLE